MKSKHLESQRLTAIEEFKKNKSARAVADQLGIPQTTVRNWIRNYRLDQNLIPETERERNLKELSFQRNRIILERTSDPNVNILGKPPLGRSALDQKLAERENQNEVSKTNPFAISRYYRQSR